MRVRRLLSLVVVGLLAAACGGGGSEPEPTTTTTTTTAPTTTTTTEPPGTPSFLTGLPVDPTVASRPVVAVKIDNLDGFSTPQVGINQADVVYEIQVEGQVTRLLSLFQSTDANPVGPIRSARGSEIDLLEELNGPLFAWHGANDILRPKVRNSSVVPRSIDDVPQLYYRERSRKAPYNSFADGTEALRASAPEGAAGPTRSIFAFAAPGQAPSPLAVPATSVTVRFPPPFGRGGGESPVTYDWDAASATWKRSQSGHPHVDTAGVQVAPANVIVRFVRALDSGTIDKAGTRVPTAEVTGEGDAWVFTAGTVTVGRWIKSSPTEPTSYVDANGAPIALTPGTTWVSLPYGQGGSSYR